MNYWYLIGGKLWQHVILKRYQRIVDQAGRLEERIRVLRDEALQDRIREMHIQVQARAGLGCLLPEALAIGRELSRRTLGMRHYDVQLIGTLALYNGYIAEMATGEGKTLMAPLAAFLHRLGRVECCTHVVTANEYLAARDAQWMAPLCQQLGLSVGLIVPGQRSSDRAAAYKQAIVYATAKEIVFDSLREPIRKKRVNSVDAILRPNRELDLDPLYDFSIVDEVDSVLIDQAGSPLSIGATSNVSPQLEVYKRAAQVAGQLIRGTHYRLLYDDRSVEMKDEGKAEARKHAGGILRFVPPGHAWERYVTCALAARYIYKKDQHYVVREGKIVLIDESTGRLLPGRQLPDGIHQALEIMNDIVPTAELRGNYQTTFQTFFRRYKKIAGMTGTAQIAAGEFLRVYGLAIVPIPPNKPSRKILHPDKVYRHRQAKYQAIVKEIVRVHATGRPILIGTGSVQISEIISALLSQQGLTHEVLNAKNHAREAEIIAQAGQRGCITVITNMAGRGVDIKLGDGVAEMGGVYLLGTDRLVLRRLDDQLTGRVGRQGDPGDCQFFLSLKDDLLRYYKGKNIRKLRRRTRFGRNDVIEDSKAEKIFSKLQKQIAHITSKQRYRVFLGEKQREKLKEEGMWEDWMDAR